MITAIPQLLKNEILANWESAEKIGSEKTPHLT
jgi:hypothetical protein